MIDGNAENKRGDAKRIRALAHLRFDQAEHAVKQAKLALELDDLKTINHLIIAIAEARLGTLGPAQRPVQ